MTASSLTRHREERMLGGVCAGLAAHLELPVATVRIAMVIFALLGGAGVLFYCWLWVLVPWNDGDSVTPLRRTLMKPGATESATSTSAAPSYGAPTGTRPSRPAAPAAHATLDEPVGALERRGSRWPVAELLLGGALLIAGVGLVLVQLGVGLHLDILLPAMAVLVGVGLAWWQIADRDRPERNQLPRVLGALALVAVGVLMFFITARQPSAITVIAAAFAVLAGVALAIAPWLLRMNRDLVTERSARAREAERAEIAAHLHDSVLQTLAAIQQRSAPGSEVARLARGQERELRDWLFRTADGADPEPREAIETELRTHAAALEAHHAVRFEVVAVGVGRHQSAPEAIVAAAREAMLNAARHAGGEVTVYVEATPQQIAIDVTDRGPGLDIDAMPNGRMGVRESILGRMERAGGTARIVPGPGGAGTAVRLTLPVTNEQGETDG